MNKKLGMKQVFIVLAEVLILFIPFTSYADSTDSAYSVSANIPEFQVNKNLSYFDLLLSPKQQESFSIHLANDGQKEATYLVDVNNAATNSNGVIDYGQTELKKDPSATYVLNQLVSPKNQEVTLKAGEEKDVTFQVAMPDKSFSGIIIGGIHISKKDNESKKLEGTAIRNKYAYVIGVKFQNKTNAVAPDLKLRSAKPGLQNSYTTIFANIQNPKPTIISKTTIDAKITKKGSEKILYETKKNNLSIAPNTNFDFPISLEKQKIAAGDYTVTIDAKEENTNKAWHLTTDFTIKADKAKKINQEAVTEKTDNSYLMIVMGVGSLLVLIILYLSYKLLKQKSR
ncbi:hypothetical protein UAO_01763 [Enterococcus villorum ATCC 700913]|uniref:DUF3324 domain-containing protein n=2 Tax=Enterococcus villorum TaxID=112904 RepID=A0ABP2UQH6_9ENTE|nr:DUF916 and DUF3324 domain-containing protein [Enterococcus villorum]EOH89031.1 hypothetical protein UAO_01763 [Enterococcus villorum ATCC 700913]EOW76298.1 hypothetical protein I591_01600 [Enterococcus villorum ATCC 700913]